jgi:hypothetical protein
MSQFRTDNLQRNGKERALRTDQIDFEKQQSKDDIAGAHAIAPRTLGAGVSVFTQIESNALTFLDCVGDRCIRNDLNNSFAELDGNKRRHDHQCLRCQLLLHYRRRDGGDGAVGDVSWKRIRIHCLQRLRYVLPSILQPQADTTGLFYAG